MNLPYMQFLARLGVVKFSPPEAPTKRRGLTNQERYQLRLKRNYTLGLTARGTPRKNRWVRLSPAEYSRLYRERLWAQGLTSKGTAPKTKRPNPNCKS